MGHQHVWQKEPPDGINRTSEERHGDKLDMAHNSHWAGPEELQNLRLVLEEDPEYENSSDWPQVVEWCSSCAITRVVKLVLPEEGMEELELIADCKVEGEVPSRDASTQTPRQKQRRRGGRRSRTGRLLAFQLMLSVKRGLPLSRLLCKQRTDARSSNAELLKMQEESASPQLRTMRSKVEEKQEDIVVHKVKEEKEEETCSREGVPSSDSSFSTLRNSQTGASPPPSQTLTQGPVMQSYPAPPPQFLAQPCFIPTFLAPNQTSQFGQMPVANWVCCGACLTWGHVFPAWITQ